MASPYRTDDERRRKDEENAGTLDPNVQNAPTVAPPPPPPPPTPGTSGPVGEYTAFGTSRVDGRETGGLLPRATRETGAAPGPGFTPPWEPPGTSQPPGGATEGTEQTGTGGIAEVTLPPPVDFTLPPIDAGSPTELPAENPLTGAIQDFASGVLDAPSRFDIPLVEQGLGLIEQDAERARETSRRELGEFASGRGLVGSNIEQEGARRAERDIRQEADRQRFNLGREMAATQAADRSAAGGLGMSAADLIFGQGMERAGFTEDQRRFDVQTQIQNRSQELQRQGMSADEAARRAQMEFQQGFSLDELGLREEMQRFAIQAELLNALSNMDVDTLEALGIDPADLGIGEGDGTLLPGAGG
ncbi:MAG: hypothetical protein ACODAE_07690 [Gemmatimonadota bacterium]